MLQHAGRRGLWIALAAFWVVGCSDPSISGKGTKPTGTGGSGSGSGAGGGFVFPTDPPPVTPGGGAGSTGMTMTSQGGVTRPCAGLECQQTSCVMGDCKQQTCAGGAKTTLSGRVFDPAGKTPLYNAIVYVPNGELAEIAEGATCDRCGAVLSGKPIATALTDVQGNFVLDNIPVGSSVPVVVQIGKWRRQLTVPTVTACQDTHVEDGVLRLPRNSKEGHIPKIALTTGGADKLECLLRKMGIEDSEFTREDGPGRINFYTGHGGTSRYTPTLGGGTFSPMTTLLPGKVDQYDMVILSCEGGQYPREKSLAARTALQAYANKGGRVFASHWHNEWIEHGQDNWPQVAKFIMAADLVSPFTSDIDQSFPKGAALAEWLSNVAGQEKGKLQITEGQHTVQSVNPALGRSWIYSNAAKHMGNNDTPPESVQYFTFNAPLGADAGQECGRVVFTDIHVSAGDRANQDFPTGCRTSELSPQEKALMFMLFDLSSCVMRDEEKPRPPAIP